MKPRYKYNKKFFKTWSPAMAWILGWTYADGCLQKNSRRIDFGMKDKEPLEKFRDLLEYNRCPIKKYPVYGTKTHSPPGSEYYWLKICSKEIWNDLYSIGLRPKKSKTIRFPGSLPSQYLKDFTRGFLEGDGTYFISKKGYPRISLKCYSHGFMNDLEFLLEKYADINGAYNQKEFNQTGFYKQETVRKLYNYLYKDVPEEIRYSRKFDILNDYFNEK